MLLSGLKIKDEVLSKNIKIKPFNDNCINPNSYNYHIGNELLEFSSEIIDPLKKSKVKKIIIDEKGYVLQPNKLYLAATLEKIGSDKYVTHLIGRSSLGRLGLFLQITAPLGHAGCYHNWTLELKVVEPLRIYPNMVIGQVTFWHVYGDRYYTYRDGKYNKHKKAHVSMFYKKGLKI